MNQLINSLVNATTNNLAYDMNQFNSQALASPVPLVYSINPYSSQYNFFDSLSKSLNQPTTTNINYSNSSPTSSISYQPVSYQPLPSMSDVLGSYQQSTQQYLNMFQQANNFGSNATTQPNYFQPFQPPSNTNQNPYTQNISTPFGNFTSSINVPKGAIIKPPIQGCENTLNSVAKNMPMMLQNSFQSAGQIVASVEGGLA